MKKRTLKQYRQGESAHEGAAWSFGHRAKVYRPVVQT